LKIDKRQSSKNKVGILLASLALTNYIKRSVALSNKPKNNVKINYIHVNSKEDKYKIKNYKLIIISDIKNNKVAYVSKEKLKDILKNQKDDKIRVNNVDFSRDDIEKINLEKLEKENHPDMPLYQQIIHTTLFTVLVALPIAYGIIENQRIKKENKDTKRRKRII